MDLASVAYLIASDPEFAAEVKENPEKAIRTVGIRLSDQDMDALTDLVTEQPAQALGDPEAEMVEGEPWAKVR